MNVKLDNTGRYLLGRGWVILVFKCPSCGERIEESIDPNEPERCYTICPRCYAKIRITLKIEEV